MRKLFAFTMAVLAILSCSRESLDNVLPEEGQNQSEKKTVRLTIVAGNPSDADTRTEIAADGHTPLWSDGDKLGVTALTQLEGGDECELFDHAILSTVAEGTFPAAEASFSGTLDLDPAQVETLYAYYPGIPAFREMEYPEDYTSIAYEEYYYNSGVSDWYFNGEFFGIHRFELDEDSEIIGAGVIVNRYQHPTSTSFDGGSDVLVSKPFAFDECTENDGEYTMPDLEFARMVSVVKLVLNPGEDGVFEGQHPEWVSLFYMPDEGDPVSLSGTGVVEFPATGNDSPVLHPYLTDCWPFDEGSIVYACLDSEYSQEGAYAISSGNPIYLLVYPGVLEAGGTLSVTVGNMEKYYSIEREIPLNRNLTLKPGKITTLNIGLTGNEDDIYVGEKNLPVDMVFAADEVDADQYCGLQITADVIGSVEDGEYLDFDENYFSCVLINSETGDEITIDYGYPSGTEPCFFCDPYEKVLTVNTPVFEEPGEWIMMVSYGSTPEEADSFGPCTITVHAAVELPAALGRDWRYDYYFNPQVHVNSTWFDPYRTEYDNHVYLKTYAASSRTQEIPEHAFRGAFLTEGEGGSFEAFSYFEQVTSVPKYAFYSCRYMTAITLPENVTSIGEHAFHFCENLTEIELPDDLENIGGYAFSDCYVLASVELPSGVTVIGANAFSACWDLTSINLDQVESIGQSAFGGCGLTGNLVLKGNATIGQYAFNASSVQSVTFENATGSGTIGAGAFANCEDLVFVVFETTTPPDLADEESCFGETAMIYVPDSAVLTYKNAWPGLAALGRIAPVSEKPAE